MSTQSIQQTPLSRDEAQDAFIAGLPPSRVLFSDPLHTGPHYVRRATGLSLSLIEKLLASRIRVEGVEHVPVDGPVLFLCNHFTRFETFILPWLLDRHTRRFVHNLAHHELFAGRFGDYLTAIGARSTKEEGIKDAITADLITGHHDWIIYPEGSMIKDKRIWNQGRFELNAPDRHGPPHTGSALMALQAALTRRRYLQAWDQQDNATLDELEARWGFSGSNLPAAHLSIVPITITYFPIRPGDNAMLRLARRLLKRLPEQLDEELSVEGNLLLGDTDISVYIGEPVNPDAWVDQLVTAHGGSAFEQVLGRAKDDLTTTVMAAIYRHVTVNFDHLFAAALRYCPQQRIRCEDLHRAIYVAARLLQASGARRRHPSIGEGLLALVTGAGYAPLDSALLLAQREGLLTVEDGWYVLNHAAISAEHGFHDVRMKNTLAVIANELEPLRPAIRAVKAALAQPRERLADLLVDEDKAEFEHDWRVSQADPGERLSSEVGAPFVIGAAPREHVTRGVVACHGYLAAPQEMRPLAEQLASAGWRVQGARLAGHGTSPDQLGKVTMADWRRSLDRALAASHAACERSVLVGFSLGGLLCLDQAARLPERVAAVVAINVPFHLSDPASRLVPAVDGWNHLAHALHLDRLRFAAIPNSPEWVDVNYTSNPVAGIHQLEHLISEARAFLPRVRCPVLLLQSDGDQVVVPRGAEEVLRLIGSDDKTLQQLHSTRHVVVRGQDSELVAGQVGDFLARVARQW